MFTVGQNVTVDGRLFQGAGVVEAYADSAGAAYDLPEKYEGMIKWNEPFPLVWVRTADGRLIRYNANDIADGIVVDARHAAQEYTPRATDTAPVADVAPTTETITKQLPAGITLTVTITLA